MFYNKLMKGIFVQKCLLINSVAFEIQQCMLLYKMYNNTCSTHKWIKEISAHKVSIDCGLHWGLWDVVVAGYGRFHTGIVSYTMVLSARNAGAKKHYLWPSPTKSTSSRILGILRYVHNFEKCSTPWYNRFGWLGVKHQITYLRKSADPVDYLGN